MRNSAKRALCDNENFEEFKGNLLPCVDCQVTLNLWGGFLETDLARRLPLPDFRWLQSVTLVKNSFKFCARCTFSLFVTLSHCTDS
ncbi:hypothetical protein RRG08_000150 [Elysia crispata]|uniref:Uncharacterized protein n=1 Tax=Elysia crispata TaxID=231223 RepID=A0AAE1D5K2_9GAST|nr:hypothetical protein RRG08_000150 [Elysia crispata]